MEDAIEKRRRKGLELLNARRLVRGINGVGDRSEQRSIPEIDGRVAEFEDALRDFSKTLVRLLRAA